MTDANQSADATLTLPAVLDLAAAEDFLATIRQKMQDAPSLRLDASGVETLTLPCIQIILAATRAQTPVAVDDPSDAFVSAFHDLGLDWRTDGAGGTEPSPAPSIDPPPEPAAEPGPTQMMSDESVQDDAQAQPESSVEAMLEAALLAPEPSPGAEMSAVETDAGSALEAPEVQQPELADAPTNLEVHVQADDVNTGDVSMAKKILTIDDSKTIRDMLMLTLADAGFEVMQAVDGQDGINVLGDKQVDVVITDINMPKMDGYAVIRHLRQSPVHKTTPILVLTTESDAEKKHLAREAGATGWMVKPFDPDRLVATIRRVSP